VIIVAVVIIITTIYRTVTSHGCCCGSNVSGSDVITCDGVISVAMTTSTCDR